MAIHPETLAGRTKWLKALEEERLTKLHDVLDLHCAGKCDRRVVLKVIKRIEFQAYLRGYNSGARGLGGERGEE